MRNKTSELYSESEGSGSSRPSLIFTPVAAPCIIERLATKSPSLLRYFIPGKIFSCFLTCEAVREAYGALGWLRAASVFGLEKWSHGYIFRYYWKHFQLRSGFSLLLSIIIIQCECEEVDSRGTSDQA